LAISFLLSLVLSKGSFPAAFSGHAKSENAVRAPFAEHVTGKAWGRVCILRASGRAVLCSAHTNPSARPLRIAATETRATPQTVNGIQQKPIEGVSMAYTFDKANANAPSTRKTQYFEMISNRGIYNDGWYANTPPPVGPWVLNAPMPDVDAYKWELYNLKEDYSQANDLAAKMPDKLKAMQALFIQEAAKYNVLPLNNSTFERAMPFNMPRSLTDNEVYALTAYILSINKLIGDNDVIDAKSLPQVKMPNRDNYIIPYPDRI
jgi:hypothetical protein